MPGIRAGSAAHALTLLRAEGVVTFGRPSSGDPEDLLGPAEVAAWLGTKKETLATWRTQNRGPRFVKIGGSVRYQRKAVSEFITANVFKSTTEADGNRR